MGRFFLPLAVALAGIVGLLLGSGLGLAFPAGYPVVTNALPPASDAALPRIVASDRTGAQAPLVVIDPGHGGFDPGASSPDGAIEKDIALALALAVRDRLIELGGVRVALTREDDRFLPLEARPVLAKALGADAFIAIHADSAPVPEASGANVYVLSARASDRAAQRLANSENRSGGGLPDTGGADDIAAILAELVRREANLESARLSQTMADELRGAMPTHTPFRRSANFAVLRTFERAGVLFEAGYLTNPDDAARLSDPQGRKAIADALASAIVTYLLLPANG
ncbi:hypothetical protein AB433_07995 [Croceicoccus naphthovorans]|uniref:N-acetylmuramoyl-L-alanine amidase n=1 Tax=Croceicoccus naphthovorans TaxID=1348774 RepID=A0A0G3XJC0_9SPHN|nr:hypothetical protein AB433_07995 [Croceicoccus naphthovorans]